jgi:hypothetical protein
MRKIAAAACVVSICSASSVFAMNLVTKAPQQEERISQNSPSLQSFPGTGQQSYVFGAWGGLPSWLSNHGIDLGLSYLSEPAWDVAGGMARGGTYAGQENLSLDLIRPMRVAMPPRLAGDLTRFDALHAGALTELIGREEEQAQRLAREWKPEQ